MLRTVLVALTLGGAVPRTEAATAKESGPAMVLPFIEDNFAAAQAKAKSAGKLLVVDAWALWCHTCLSMRNFVFTDPILKEVADRFVYASIDTEQPTSTAFTGRFPITTWPTLLVLDPRRSEASAEEQVVARWTGAMTARELLLRLRELSGPQPAHEPLLAQADAAAETGRWSEAASLYEKAAQQPAARAQARLGQIQALRETDKAACAALADSVFDELGKSALATDFAAYAADCQGSLTDVDQRQKLRSRLRTRLERLVQDERAELLADDRSDGYGTLTELADALGDAPAGDRYAVRRAELLEAAAKAAANPAAAATFDAHRLEAYRRLKRYGVAEAMLLGSRKALPGDYNPPARLARLYHEMGRLDAALVQINQAIALCAGPRRIGMYELRASIQHGLGRTPEAIQSIQTAITMVQEQTKPGAKRPGKLASLEKMLAALISTQPPSSAVAAQVPGDTTDKKPPRPARKVAKRDTVH